MDHTLANLWKTAVAAYGRRPLIVSDSDGSEFCYADADQVVRQLIGRLDRAGVAKGDAICVYTPFHTEAALAFWAAMQMGALFVPIDFHASADPERLRRELIAIKGIGEWTAQYILMRTLKHPDAMPFSDLGLRKAVASGATPATEKRLKQMSLAWKPWRAYAAMHLWSSLD